MVVTRCRGIGPPSSSIVLGTLFWLAADLRPFPCRVSISQSTGIVGIPLPALSAAARKDDPSRLSDTDQS